MNLFITLLFIGSLAFFLYWFSKRSGEKTIPRNFYVDALHDLLEGKIDDAIEKLKHTIRDDTDNVMAYIKLGDILREKGYPVRASKVHRNLLIRTTLSEEDIQTTLYHLVLDYRKASMLDKAIETAEQLLERNKKHIEGKRLLLELYEEKADWDKAFFLRQSLNKWTKKGDQHILALYKVYTGLDLVKKGAEREARIRFREAIKLDRACIPAYLYFGDSYMREGRYEEALKIWKTFALKYPQHAHWVLDRLDDVLYALGKYSEMEPICEEIVKAKPTDPSAYFKLIDIYEKKGRHEEALELARQTSEAHPHSPRCRHLYIRLLKESGNVEKALETAMVMLEKETEEEKWYTCKHCGNKTKEILWRCPQCKEWYAYL